MHIKVNSSKIYYHYFFNNKSFEFGFYPDKNNVQNWIHEYSSILGTNRYLIVFINLD